MDVFEDPYLKSNYGQVSSTETCQRTGCLAGAENEHKLRDTSRDTQLENSSSMGNTEVATRDNGLPSTDLKDCPRTQTNENTGSSISVWSVITSRAWAVFQNRSVCTSDCGLRGNMHVRWNAAVRRAMSINPVRRLQERVFSCRWVPSPTRSIWLLGVCYPLSDGEECVSTTETYKQFETDLHSRIWITYRKGFQAIMGTKLTTDVGWGCMIRSGQMLLAQALICHHLGRSWRRSDVGAATHSSLRGYLEILQSFGDMPTCPLSIHNILQCGGPYGLVAGSWLGPYAMCRSLEALVGSDKTSFLLGSITPAFPMAIHVISGDAEGERGGAPCICIDAVLEMCSSWEEIAGEDCALLLLIPLVLGLNKVNPRYLPLLYETFTFPQSLGILGGKPGASTYLVGIQGDQVFYLDPHHVQQVSLVSPDNPKADTSTYHCSNVKRMALSAIDPSLALGFYCRNQEDFRDLCKRAADLERKGDGAPMFTVVQSKRCDRVVKDHHAAGRPGMESMSFNADTKTSEEGWQML